MEKDRNVLAAGDNVTALFFLFSKNDNTTEQRSRYL